MNSLQVSMNNMVKSTAYHEAGHIVTAVLQKMPLQDGGIHIDLEGSGVAYYCHRLPGLPDNSEISVDEREKTIVALYSGRIAQFMFLQDIDYRDYPDSWKSDWIIAAKLLDEIFPLSELLTEKYFYLRAQELIIRYWSFIENLASELWGKPITPLPQSEYEKGWSQGRKKQEKVVSRSEVQAFFAKLGISCLLWP